jgi:RNA polymerase sigma-70 factor (ECF subfamily)
LGVTDRLRPVLRRGKDSTQSVLVNFDVDRTAVVAARRDPRAFEALYRKYVAQVYNFALYELRDPHAAEDLTAQVFMRALDGLQSFREQSEPPGSSFRVWLFQICRNTISNERRRVRRHPESPLELALEVASRDDVQAEALEREQLSRAWEQIGKLPTERRQALVLRFVEEMSTREIGEVLNRSEGATRVLIHRALQTVARQIGRGSDESRD